MEYRLGKTSISDYTSRHHLPRADNTKVQLGSTKDVRHYVNFVIENSIPRAISKEEIVTAKETDQELQKVSSCIQKSNTGT